MQWLEKLIDLEALTPHPVGQSEHEQVETLNTLARALLHVAQRDMGQVDQGVGESDGMDAELTNEKCSTKRPCLTLPVMRALYPGEQTIIRLAPLTEHW